jgi:hypothetical protein
MCSRTCAVHSYHDKDEQHTSFVLPVLVVPVPRLAMGYGYLVPYQYFGIRKQVFTYISTYLRTYVSSALLPHTEQHRLIIPLR